MKRKEKNRHYFLDSDSGVKHRKQYMDNQSYVNGVFDGRKKVMRALTKEEKEFLDKFNKEYYGAKFDKDENNNLHKIKEPKSKITRIKSSIRYYKKKAKLEKNPDKCKKYYKKIEDLTERLLQINPIKELTDANNSRNSCIMNSHVRAFGNVNEQLEDAIDDVLDSVDKSKEDN